MAITSPTKVALPEQGEFDGLFIRQWALAQGDSGVAVDLPRFSDKAVQVAGTWGTAVVAIEGTIDGTTYATLTDPQGNALSFTADKIEAITELVRAVRPVVTGGNGTTALVVSLIGRN